MNKKLLALTGSICFLLLGIVVNAQQTGTLTIEASNFGNETGKAVINLFRQQDDIPEKPFVQLVGVIVDGKSKIYFKNIPYGEYAVILFHDENANGILDHRWGFPHEPMGFSNGWTLSLFSGMPTFNKLKFKFDEVSSTYMIAIR